ncbi:caspase domain-containing protein, partial [Mycena epipterygia]
MTPIHLFQSTFALIIGIDKYKSPAIPRLNGCKNDAEEFRKFLIEDCSIPHPDTRIVSLIGQKATRRKIIKTFLSHLINNPEIPDNGALMIFFFAGHGSRCPVTESGKTVETICPYDIRTKHLCQYVHGIPDYVFGWLLEDLSRKKGTNIAVILDCCHSGGMSRNLDGARRLNNDDTPISLRVDLAIARDRLSAESLST